MRTAFILIFFTLLLHIQNVSGQYYDTGEDPSSVKWLQIKTNRFTVIYPEKYGGGGKAFAASMDQAYSKLTVLFPEKKFKIPVVIHSLTTQSNGYVAWAPKRMEIYPTPEQNAIPLDPNAQLALHELAHVFQIESLNTGFSKAMSYILGEQITGVVSSLLPLWLLEGDAVFAESILSGSGRGRNASFQKQIKALTVEDGRFYKYDKGINGSFKDFIPDHYQSGFQMVTWAQAKYDPHIWDRVLKFTGEQPFTLNPVNISLSRNARLTKEKLFKETFDTLKTIWTKEISDNNALVYESVNPPKKGKYINYYSPVFAGTDSIIAIKTSLIVPPSFVLINPSEKTEKIIHTPGQVYPFFISYAKGKIVWVENQYDPRWENRNYSVIKLKNLYNNKIVRLSNKSRYLSACISPDGEKIAAVENTISNINNLVFIDSETGNVLKTVTAPGNTFLQHPQWAEDGRKITVISLTEEGEGILSYSLSNQNWDTLIEAGNDDLQGSFLRNDSLFFISSKSGTDNIYLQNPDKKIRSLTASRFGTNDLTLDGDKIYFSDYTSKGNNVCITGIDATPEFLTHNTSSASFIINRIEINNQPVGPIAGNVYTPEPYRKWKHLFRFHSWLPFYADIEQIKSDPSSVRPGVSLMTQNSLSTLISTIGYEYSQQKNNVFHTRVTWKGWYPVVESQLDYGDNPLILKSGDTVANPSSHQPALRFSNKIFIPLQFSSGKFTEFLYPSLTSEYNNKYIFIKEKGTYDFGQTILTGRLYFSNSYSMALRDIYPRWAQTFDLSYTYAPFDKVIYGTDISVRTSFYFPGIFPNNGIKLRFEMEKQEPSKYLYGNRISFPRGYNNITSTELGFFSVDYVIPLVYPDFNISSLLYVKRIRTDLFYDYASGTGNYSFNTGLPGTGPSYSYNKNNEKFSSFGLELMADFYVLRIPFMISCGLQAAWRNISEQPYMGVLFNVNLFGMSLGKRHL